MKYTQAHHTLAHQTQEHKQNWEKYSYGPTPQVHTLTPLSLSLSHCCRLLATGRNPRCKAAGWRRHPHSSHFHDCATLSRTLKNILFVKSVFVQKISLRAVSCIYATANTDNLYSCTSPKYVLLKKFDFFSQRPTWERYSSITFACRCTVCAGFHGTLTDGGPAHYCPQGWQLSLPAQLVCRSPEETGHDNLVAEEREKERE